jgi:YfiR/HmsC-like
VEVIGAGTRVRSCHLLYIGAAAPKRWEELETAVHGAPVLTVSSVDRFAESGGIAQLIEDRERMRFAINVDSATRARLKLSSKLLSLAQIVKDDPNAARP